jgi:hypothetical protein
VLEEELEQFDEVSIRVSLRVGCAQRV